MNLVQTIFLDTMEDENARARFMEELDRPLPGRADNASPQVAEDEMALFNAVFGGGKG